MRRQPKLTCSAFVVTQIANVFKTNKFIKTLKLVNVAPTNTAMDQLAQAFKTNPPAFEELNISNNPLEVWSIHLL